MSSEFGKNIKVSVFGQSHSKAIGVKVEGLPEGEAVNLEKLQRFMDRRKPSDGIYSTKRNEPDQVEVLSGLVAGCTCGAPFTAIIENKDQRSQDYKEIKDVPRPGHADYTAYVKYKGCNDVAGGGHFSGRMTAPICIAGGLALQILERQGIKVSAHIVKIGKAEAPCYNPMNPVNAPETPLLTAEMEQEILEVAEAKDSIGGVIECAITGMPAGIGDPMFDGVENVLAKALFGIPAVKGLEFGAGFKVASMRGSENNDPYRIIDGEIKPVTNNAGGILGGITSGMPVIFRVAIKPTPSIGKAQNSVSLSEMKDTILEVKGRHDSCIVPRAVPVVEAVAALCMLDLLSD